MVEKTVGYVELEWSCPRCGTKNPGPQKTCTNCGGPQPAEVAFDQGGHAELVTDQKLIEAAEKGPDIHCPYCGARNPADAVECSQCGGSLKEGVRRESGRVIGAYATESAPIQQIPCPSCGTANPDTRATCSACGAQLKPPTAPIGAIPAPAVAAPRSFNLLWIGAGVLAVIVVLCIGIFALTSLRRESLVGNVAGVHWERSVAIEELSDMSHQGFRQSIPPAAVIGACTLKYSHTQPEPAPVATEVCGTAYTKDTGSGVGKVVMNCQYRVYADYCDYTVKEWHEIRTVNLQGSDLNPAWPKPVLSSQQRSGRQTESYAIVFQTSKGQYTYTTSDPQLYARCQPGSQWELAINALNGVISIQPK